MRYIIIPLVILGYFWATYTTIKNFKLDWKDNLRDDETPVLFRKLFLCTHFIVLITLGVGYLITLIIKYW